MSPFKSPFFLIHSFGKETIYEDFVQGTDVSNLLSHTENSYYIASSSAPSFLDRLEGKLEADENGIESLVYLPELSLQGIPVKDKSIVDYIYFSDSNPISYHIQGMPNWFKLDSEHLSIYQVSGLAT